MPERLKAPRFFIELRVDAITLGLLRGDGAPLLGHAPGVVFDAAPHRGRGPGGVLAVELHLVIQRLALGRQFGQPLLGGLVDRLGLRQCLGAAGIVRGLVGVARDQRLVAADGVARALLREFGFAVLPGACFALGGTQGGRDDAPRAAAAVEFALFAVDAREDRPVRRQPPAMGVHAAVNAACRRGRAGLRGNRPR